MNKNLSFPFEVKREEDGYGWGDIKSSKPFSYGHIMEALSIEKEEDKYGIILKVREGSKIGYIPLCDVEVTSRANPCFCQSVNMSFGSPITNKM